MLLESGDLIPVIADAVNIPWTRRKAQILNFLHRGTVTFKTYVYDSNVGDIAPLATYFNPEKWTVEDLNNFGVNADEDAAKSVDSERTDDTALKPFDVKASSLTPRLVLYPELEERGSRTRLFSDMSPTNVDDDFLGPSKRRKLAQDLGLDDPIAEYVKSPFILDVAEFIDSDLDLSKPDIGKLRKAPPPPLQSLSTSAWQPFGPKTLSPFLTTDSVWSNSAITDMRFTFDPEDVGAYKEDLGQIFSTNKDELNVPPSDDDEIFVSPVPSSSNPDEEQENSAEQELVRSLRKLATAYEKLTATW